MKSEGSHRPQPCVAGDVHREVGVEERWKGGGKGNGKKEEDGLVLISMDIPITFTVGIRA